MQGHIFGDVCEVFSDAGGDNNVMTNTSISDLRRGGATPVTSDLS
jgi:hypothetical protein